MPHEMNPFLGFRALRISISETGDAMFRTQIRALLRASVHGQLRIMFPMVALLKEFRAAKAVFDEEKRTFLLKVLQLRIISSWYHDRNPSSSNACRPIC